MAANQSSKGNPHNRTDRTKRKYTRKGMTPRSGPAKAGKRHRSTTGPMTPRRHILHSFRWWRRNHDHTHLLCPCGSWHISPAWQGEDEKHPGGEIADADS